jgi:hypothetical protein
LAEEAAFQREDNWDSSFLFVRVIFVHINSLLFNWLEFLGTPELLILNEVHPHLYKHQRIITVTESQFIK